MSRLVPILGLVLFGVACSGDGSPAGSSPMDSTAVQDSLHFLHPAVWAPALGERQVSFWAVRGETREVRIMYRAPAGSGDSVELARFRVDSRSLVNYPDGTPIAQGDSVLITLQVVDTLRFITEFSPQGLEFSPSRPARLWLKFGECDPDLNGDGKVDSTDSALLLDLRIWRQEHPGDPWSLLPGNVDTSSQEVDADIPGFTRYALSY